jgi:hypothetical protein
VEKLYYEFLTARYGELRAFVNDFGYFEITSKSDDDVIAHISIRDSKEYNSSLNIHLSHRDNVVNWFDVSENHSKFIVKSFIFNHFNVENSNQLRVLFHRELIGVLNHCV